VGLLAASTSEHAPAAAIMADELGWVRDVRDAGPPGTFPGEAGVLDGQTLFTRLRAHELGAGLRVDEGDRPRTPEAFREVMSTGVLTPGATAMTGPSVASNRVYVRNSEEIVALAVEGR